ncbi:MAG: hypothetical protein ACRDH8_00045 [Actinomycetota bacterium]
MTLWMRRAGLAALSAAMLMGLPATARGQSAPATQLRAQVQVGGRSTDPRPLPGAMAMMVQQTCGSTDDVLEDGEPTARVIRLSLWRRDGQPDKTQTGIPKTTCDRRLQHTSAFKIHAWVTHPETPGKRVKSRRMTVGAALQLTARLANSLAPEVLATGQRASITVELQSRAKSVRQMIRGLAIEYGVDVGTAMRVAACESGFNPRARSALYGGVYQQSFRHWPSRARSYGHPGESVFDAYANIDVSLQMAKKVGWGHWGCA